MSETQPSGQKALVPPDFDGAAEALRGYRDKYKGQRCFVIGNGPNLRVRDLDILREKGEFSIASNKIYKIFDKTDWRPSIYTSMAPGVVRMPVPEVEALQCELKLFAVTPDSLMYPAEGALPLKLIPDFEHWILSKEKPPFSEDIADCVYDGQSVTYVNLQLAAYLGFSNIVLLGVKHAYKTFWSLNPMITKENWEEYVGRPEHEIGVLVEMQGTWRDHFYEDDPQTITPESRQDTAYYSLEEATRAFEAAKEYASGHSVEIVNASVDSGLKVFEEVSPEKLLLGKTVEDLAFEPDWKEAREILAGYRNKYEGKRCFIIGSGPSLRAEDLDKIKDEYSFACNLTYMIFDKTEWRPTFYAIQDKPFSIEYVDSLSAVPSELKFLAIGLGGKMYPIKGAIPVRMLHNVGYWLQKGTLPPFSDDAAHGVHDGLTVTYFNLQLAVYMGFKEIVLLGMDHQYKYQWQISQKVRDDPEQYFDKRLQGRGYEVKGVEQDHFFPDYWEFCSGSKDRNSVYCIEEVTLAYMAAREYAKEHGIRIVNATRGGKLEVFARVNFDKLMSPKPAQPKGAAGGRPSYKKKKLRGR